YIGILKNHMSQYYKNLFEKFINQNITPEELDILLDWVDRHEDFRDIEILERLWYKLDDTKPTDVEKAERIKSKLRSRILQVSITRNLKVRRLNPWLVGATAAVLVIIASYIFIVQYLPSEVVVSSDYGEIVRVELPDKSVVSLNANSRICYPRNWDFRKNRMVHLEGEAFFKVKKDVEHGKKFVVHTKDLYVEVLGTEFNVNTRNLSSRVVLQTGTVKLSTKKSMASFYLSPGEEAGLDQHGMLAKSKIGILETPTSWKEGSMVLKDVKLSEIVAEYKNIFGESFPVAEELLMDQLYTIVFPITDKEKAFTILKNLVDSSTNKMLDK